MGVGVDAWGMGNVCEWWLWWWVVAWWVLLAPGGPGVVWVWVGGVVCGLGVGGGVGWVDGWGGWGGVGGSCAVCARFRSLVTCKRRGSDAYSPMRSR